MTSTPGGKERELPVKHPLKGLAVVPQSVLTPSPVSCSHHVSNDIDALCSIQPVTDLTDIPASVLLEVPVVIARIAESGDDSDIHAFSRAVDRVQTFSSLSPTSVRHPQAIELLQRFRARFQCIDCHPVEYLRVRLAVAGLMNGCGRFDDATALLRRCRTEARRVLDSGVVAGDGSMASGVRRVVHLMEGCVQCSERRVVYPF